MSFSENLQFLRTQRGMTQEQLAERLEVSRQSVSKWESCASYPEMEKLIQLCELFRVDLDTLVRGDARASRVEDSAQYDRHMNRFALMIAGGVGIILLGVSLMLLLWALGKDETVSAAVFLTLVAVAVTLLIVAGLRHGSFERRHPVIQPFYREEELERFEGRFPILIAAPVAAILIGVVWVMLLSGRAEQMGEAAEGKLMAFFLLDIAAAVTMLVWAGIQHSKYDLSAWNREHDQSPQAVARRKKTAWISGVIIMAATAIYLAVGFGCMALTNDYGNDLGWRWGWIVYPVAGVLCAVASTVVNREE